MEISAKQMVESTCYWVKDHKTHFKTIMSLVHEQVDEGNPRVMEGDIALLARDRGIEWSYIEEIKRDHNMWAVMTRYMVMLRPRLARTLCFRKSKVDGFDMIDAWHRIVNPTTTFLASSWQEAKEMVKNDDVAAD